MAASAQEPEVLVAASSSPQLPHSPADEEERRETMKVLGIAGDKFAPDPMLDSMCKTISKLMDVPIAGVSMVQDKQLRMRAVAGLPADFSCARDGAFCSWTLLPRKPEILVIEDTQQDPRFKSLQHCEGEEGLRFYAGAPLVASNGTRMGAVCVFDTKPRKMKAEEYNLLSNFSEIAMRRLEEREFKRIKAAPPTASATLLVSPDFFPRTLSPVGKGKIARQEAELAEPIVLCDVSSNRWWSLLYCNTAFSDLTGVTVDSDQNAENNFWKLFRAANPEMKAKIQDEVEDSIHRSKDFSLLLARRESTSTQAFEMTFRPATRANLGNHASFISVPNIVAAAEIGETATSYYFATVKQAASPSSTAQRVSEKQAKATKKPPRQQSFMSEPYMQSRKEEGGPSSRPPADDGMRDVTMGVLCSNTADGLVYRARWKKRSVSVKVLEVKQSSCLFGPQFGNAPVPMEAALSINLDHPNIVSTFKVVVEDSPSCATSSEKMILAWMVREWCGRGHLMDALNRGWLRLPSGEPNLAAILAVAQEVASAVKYLHDQDIIYGDICPESVLLADDKGHSASKHKDFIAKLSEFGTSVKCAEPVQAIAPGTASHAAPELMSKGQVSKATDVYAFGMLLWELYNGQAVWPMLNYSQLQRRVVAAKEKPPMPANVPLGYNELFEKCLENEAGLRPTFEEISESLRRLAQEEAAGQLIYALAAPPERKGSKLFRMDSKSKKERKQLASITSRPSQELAKMQLNGKSNKDMTESKESKKSLFKRLIPGLKG